MSPSVRRRAVVGLLVLLAGCAGATVPTGDSNKAFEETITPAPVPTDAVPVDGAPIDAIPVEGDPTDGDPIDGDPVVHEEIEGRPVGLATRHAAALSDRSVTVLGRRVVTGSVGVLRRTEWDRRVAADRDSYHAVRSGSTTWGWDGQDPIDRVHVYHADDRTLVQHATDGAVRYEVIDEPARGGPLTDLDGEQYLRRVFGAFETWDVARHPNGTLILDGRGLEHPAAIGARAPLSDLRNATVSARVEPTGLVSRTDVRFRATLQGSAVSVVEVRRFVSVGSTATDRPPWYGAALAGAETNATAARNGTTVMNGTAGINGTAMADATVATNRTISRG